MAMNMVLSGAAASMAAEQGNTLLEKASGEHAETLLIRMAGLLEIIAESVSSELTPPDNKTISLQQYPVSYQIPTYHRPHCCIFIPSGYSGANGSIIPGQDSLRLMLELPTGGFHIQDVQNGWTQLDLVPGTLVSLASGPASWPVTFSFRDDVIQDNPHGTSPGESALATLTNVVGSASSVPLLAANAQRRGMTLYNDSTSILFLAFAATASNTAYTVQIAPGGFYEMPAPIYTGVISGIWSSAAGNARITELN